jgi:hypothetical protein
MAPHELVLIEGVRMRLLDPMAERLEQVGGVVDRGATVRMEWRAVAHGASGQS